MLTRMRNLWRAAGAWWCRLGGGRLSAPGRWFAWTVLVTIGALALAATAVYVVDPFQVYRKPTLYKPVFDDSYSTMPGIIRHYDYDGIVVGSSMCQNFRISDIRQRLDWNCVKLTPAGCRPATIRLLTTMACAHRPVKHVLLGLDVLNFGGDPDSHRVTLPDYLYDDTPWNDYRYLWNRTVLFEKIPDALKANFLKKPKYRQKLDADRMWAWDFEDGRKQYGRAAVMLEDEAQGWSRPAPINDAEARRMRASFEKNILALVRAQPKTEFVVFLPPYSAQAWLRASQCGNLERLLAFKRQAVCDLLAEPNVKLYDFQDEAEIVCNLDNYKDPTHYSPAINRLILGRIAQDRNRVRSVPPPETPDPVRVLTERFAAEEAARPAAK
jgi:hypothetical protein